MQETAETIDFEYQVNASVDTLVSEPTYENAAHYFESRSAYEISRADRDPGLAENWRHSGEYCKMLAERFEDLATGKKVSETDCESMAHQLLYDALADALRRTRDEENKPDYDFNRAKEAIELLMEKLKS